MCDVMRAQAMLNKCQAPNLLVEYATKSYTSTLQMQILLPIDFDVSFDLHTSFQMLSVDVYTDSMVLRVRPLLYFQVIRPRASLRFVQTRTRTKLAKAPSHHVIRPGVHSEAG